MLCTSVFSANYAWFFFLKCNQWDVVIDEVWDCSDSDLRAFPMLRPWFKFSARGLENGMQD